MALNSVLCKYIFSHFKNAYYYYLVDFILKHDERGIVFSVLFWARPGIYKCASNILFTGMRLEISCVYKICIAAPV